MGEECHKITTSSYKITPMNIIYFMVTIVKNNVLHIWKLPRKQSLKGVTTGKKIKCVWWDRLTRLIVVIVLQYTQISSHYVVHLKIM